jgi:hypothetical protein
MSILSKIHIGNEPFFGLWESHMLGGNLGNGLKWLNIHISHRGQKGCGRPGRSHIKTSY